MSEPDSGIELTPRNTVTRASSLQLFTTEKITRYKRCIRRSDNMATDSPLAAALLTVARSFMNTYPILEEATDSLPIDKNDLLKEFTQPLPEQNRLFSRDYFNMPLAPVGLLKDIADLYDLPDPTQDNIRSLELEEDYLNNDSLLLHLWLASIAKRPPSVLHTVVNTFTLRRSFVYDINRDDGPEITHLNPPSSEPTSPFTPTVPRTNIITTPPRPPPPIPINPTSFNQPRQQWLEI